VDSSELTVPAAHRNGYQESMILIGRSFGGYLAPRAAALEHRLAALIADPGQLDMFDMTMARMPHEMREAIEQDDPKMDDPKVDSFLEKMVQDDARHFFLAARMRAFGAKTLKEFLLMQREYSLKGLAEDPMPHAGHLLGI
jgi:hypothetical protein